MDIVYAITPFVTWTVAGSLKFLINSLRAKQAAFKQIGYGGLPSNHSAVVSSVAALIAFRESIQHPAFGVAVALAFIVMLDANSLRRQLGQQASMLNKINKAQGNNENILRERMGHTKLEIAAGILLGIAVAYLLNYLI